jgi:hypothetical protein
VISHLQGAISDSLSLNYPFKPHVVFHECVYVCVCVCINIYTLYIFFIFFMKLHFPQCMMIMRQIRFGSQNHCEVAAYSPDGTSIVTASADGFLEVLGVIYFAYLHEYIYHKAHVIMLCYAFATCIHK